MIIAVTGHRPDAFLVSHYSPETIARMASDMVCVFKREFGDDLLFAVAEALLTFVFKDGGDVHPGTALYLVVAILELEGQGFSELTANGGFAGSHGADEKDVV